MVKFPATGRVLFHHFVNVLLIVFKLSAGLAKHLAVLRQSDAGVSWDNPHLAAPVSQPDAGAAIALRSNR
jgi:hypothetical protein